MRNISEIKTPDDMRKVFALAADGETVLVSNPDVVVLSKEKFDMLSYHDKIEQAIRRVRAGEGVVFKTMEELEAMAQ